MGVDGLNPHGWVYDYQIADLLGYPVEDVQAWMKQNDDITQRHTRNTWRMEARLFLEHRATCRDDIVELRNHKRGRPRTRIPEEKLSKMQIRRSEIARQNMPKRIAKAVPDLTEAEIAYIINVYDFAYGVVGGNMRGRGYSLVVSMVAQAFRRIYWKPRSILKSNAPKHHVWERHGHRVVTQNFEKDNMDYGA